MALTEKDISHDNGAEDPRISEKEPESAHTPKGAAAVDGDNNPDQEPIDDGAQAGVKGVQAAAAVWTKAHLILAYTM